jgi:hypothetical protein
MANVATTNGHRFDFIARNRSTLNAQHPIVLIEVLALNLDVEKVLIPLR